MDKTQMQQLVDAVLGSLFVELEASGRHVHVTAEQACWLEELQDLASFGFVVNSIRIIINIFV